MKFQWVRCFDSVARPLIPCGLRHRGVVLPANTLLLVDTGADVTTLPFSLASLLGFSTADLESFSSAGLGGTTQVWRPRADPEMDIEIGGVWHKLPAVVFAENTPPIMGLSEVLSAKHSIATMMARLSVAFLLPTLYATESHDRVVRAVRECGLEDYRLLVSEQHGRRYPLGYARTANGLAHAAMSDPGCEMLVFLNDDIEPEPGALRALAEATATAGRACLQAWERRGDDSTPYAQRDPLTNQIVRPGTTVAECSWIPSIALSCAAVPVAAWREIGELDEQLSPIAYAEDTDWCIRAWQKGWRCGVYTGAVYRHERRATVKRLQGLGDFEREAIARLEAKWRDAPRRPWRTASGELEPSLQPYFAARSSG